MHFGDIIHADCLGIYIYIYISLVDLLAHLNFRLPQEVITLEHNYTFGRSFYKDLRRKNVTSGMQDRGLCANFSLVYRPVIRGGKCVLAVHHCLLHSVHMPRQCSTIWIYILLAQNS